MATLTAPEPETMNSKVDDLALNLWDTGDMKHTENHAGFEDAEDTAGSIDTDTYTPPGGVEESDEKTEQSELRALVSRVLQGNNEAFNIIVDQYSPLMLRTAAMIVGDRDIAEDVVQDALIQAWHHLPDLREADALRPWLMRIVVNQCISLKRRLTRSTAFIRQALSEQETDLLAQAADYHKGRMERDWDLAHAIDELPTKQRVVIVLHYYNGMTLPEMAQALLTSENTLKKRIQAALTNLRRTLCVTDMDIGFNNHKLIKNLTPSAA